MVNSLISWVVVGVLTFVWYWIGYEWPYLANIPRGDWSIIWVLYTLMAILICRRTGAGSGASVVEAVSNRLRDIFPHLVGITLSLLVGLTIWSFVHGGFDMNEYIQAVIVAVACSLTTAGWVGALEDASK